MAAKTVELALLVEGRPEGGGGRRFGETDVGLLGLGAGRIPVAAQLQEVGPVQEALAAERDDVRVGVAPARERRGPLLRPAHIEDAPALLDRRAVDDADDDRRHLALGHGDHRLVDERQSLVEPAELDERTAPAEQAHRGEIGVVEPRRDLREGAEPLQPTGRIARLDHPDGLGHEEVAGRDAVDPRLLDDRGRPCHPATASCRFALVEERVAEPEGEVRRAARITLGHRLSMGPSHDLLRLHRAAQELGGDPEVLEILERHGRIVDEPVQRRVHLGPRRAGVRVSTAPQRLILRGRASLGRHAPMVPPGPTANDAALDRFAVD